MGGGRSGATAVGTAAAALRDGGDLGGGGLSSLFPSKESLARDFLDFSHVSMGKSHQNILLSSLHQKNHPRYSVLSSLYRREKETGCPKGNPVILRGFWPKNRLKPL